MKKNLKWLAVLLCLVIFAAMAMGSGSSAPEEVKDIVAATEDAVSDAVNEAVSEAGSEGAGEETSASKAQEEAAASVTIEEQVLVDRDGIVVTAKEYVTDSIWGDGIKLLIENNSEKTAMVSCDALIVNNFMITDLFVSEVAPGKKANETMYLSTSELKAAGIEKVGQIEVYFRASDTETYDTIFDGEYVTMQTSEFANMDTAPADTGMELYNEGGIRIVGKTVDENSFWGTAIVLYSENTSGKNVTISVDEMSINGFMMSPFFSTTVYNEKMSIDDITIFSSDLEENGIESIEEVELKFNIYDADTFDTLANSDAITFSAK
ncbi:MAG: hypothetical protein IKY23_07935 [Lachnospiraceae bacterium]|nr:hypothetical protein [Lachnospiraceae bacterium]